MERTNRKAEILDVTMKMVNKHGLSFFTTKKVADCIGISEALIYKYFSTKDQLLYSCYEVMHKKIAARMDSTLYALTGQDLSEVEFIRLLWFAYFDLLVEEDYRTVFYFSYRDSPYLQFILANDEDTHSYFKSFISFVNVMNEKYQAFNEVTGHFLWTYILDTTGLFAKRIISKDLPDDKESRNLIWNLMFKGISGIMGL